MHQLATALAVVGTLGLVTPTRADTVTIDQALDRAAHRPAVELSRLDTEAARANARGAALPLYNPDLSASAGPQFGAGSSSAQFQVGIAQTIELAGKRGARVRLADTQTHGTEIANQREQLQTRIEAWRTYERALVMRDRLDTRKQVETLARALVVAMQKSAAAGGTTKLRVNLATADAGRATQERVAAEADDATARAALATAIGAAAGEVVEPTGTVADLPPLTARSDELVTRALRNNPQVLASDNQVAVAQAAVADADARGTPDVTVGITYAYAPDPEGANAILGTISIPLAIRNRNEGARAAARVGVRRAELERTYARTEVERAVRLAAANYERARAAVAGFDREVTERLNENLAAAQDAFTKGGLDFVELTTAQRELTASRAAFLDAQLAMIDAWAELALATGMEVKP